MPQNDAPTIPAEELQPGDMQFLKNASILHKRTAYEDWGRSPAEAALAATVVGPPGFSAGDETLRRGISQP
ncbi:MAG TPA: hypothetical protein VMT68_15175 [Caulobacteraceae bacterium]|nr:hypothetical protein [Caulobacteraceae bacterium]